MNAKRDRSRWLLVTVPGSKRAGGSTVPDRTHLMVRRGRRLAGARGK